MWVDASLLVAQGEIVALLGYGRAPAHVRVLARHAEAGGAIQVRGGFEALHRPQEDGRDAAGAAEGERLVQQHPADAGAAARRVHEEPPELRGTVRLRDDG